MSFISSSLVVAQCMLVGLCALVMATEASAGMPSALPDDVATVMRLRESPAQRIQAISFFVLALLLSALFVKFLWNGLRSEFTKLPRVSYLNSLMITIAWGLMFCIVLLMISGARELMTPGAWEKAGATYRLSDDSGVNTGIVEP